MSWRYVQATGEMFNPAGAMLARGYSGHGIGRNNPAYSAVKNFGPIPAGAYTVGEPFDSAMHGPCCIPLTPAFGTDVHGRGGFLVHGDSTEHPGEASRGCIIQPRFVRDLIVAGKDKVLEVI